MAPDRSDIDPTQGVPGQRFRLYTHLAFWLAEEAGHFFAVKPATNVDDRDPLMVFKFNGLTSATRRSSRKNRQSVLVLLSGSLHVLPVKRSQYNCAS